MRLTILIKCEGLFSIKQNFDNTGNADSSAGSNQRYIKRTNKQNNNMDHFLNVNFTFSTVVALLIHEYGLILSVALSP